MACLQPITVSKPYKSNKQHKLYLVKDYDAVIARLSTITAIKILLNTRYLSKTHITL